MILKKRQLHIEFMIMSEEREVVLDYPTSKDWSFAMAILKGSKETDEEYKQGVAELAKMVNVMKPKEGESDVYYILRKEYRENVPESFHSMIED